MEKLEKSYVSDPRETDILLWHFKPQSIMQWALFMVIIKIHRAKI